MPTSPLYLVSPISHISGRCPYVSTRDIDRPLRWGLPVTGDIRCLTVTADPRVVNCVWSSHRQSIHTLHPMLTLEVLDWPHCRWPANVRPSPFPISTSRLCRHIHDWVQTKPVITRHTWPSAPKARLSPVMPLSTPCVQLCMKDMPLPTGSKVV